MSFASLLLATSLLQAGNGFPAVTAERGTIHVAWQEDAEGPGKDEIYYSHSTETGAFTAPLNISRNPGISDLPRIVAHDDIVSVVWSDTSPGTYQVMLAQSEDGGNSFSPPRILSDGMASTGPPDIAWQDGHLSVVWDETDNGGESRIIFWDSMGSRPIAGGNRGFVPSIAARGRRLVITWNSDVDYKQRIYAVRSDDSGKSFSEPALVSANFQRSVTPSIGLAPNGRSFIVWSDRTSGRSEIFLSSSDENAENYSAPKVIASPGRECIFPVIQVMGDDESAIAWITRDSIIYAQVSAAGEPKGPPRTLTTSDTTGVPRLFVDGGRPIVVWKDFRAGELKIFISTNNAPAKALFQGEQK